MSQSRFLLGIDEAGTGAWAGPFCLGGTVFPPETIFAEVLNKDGLRPLRDSKKLTPKMRESLREPIEREAIACGVSYAYPADIQKRGHGAAWQDAIIELLNRLLENLAEKEIVYGRVDVMIDGNTNHALRERIQREVQNGLRVNFEANADEKYFAVCAASILAKTERDSYMHELHQHFPEYGFNKNVGYGTEKHAEALVLHGRTEHHRPLTDKWDLVNR